MSRCLCFMLDQGGDAGLIVDGEARPALGAGWHEAIDDIVPRGCLDTQDGCTGDRWKAQPGRYQQPLPHAASDERWVGMTRIFALDEQVPNRG